MAYVISASLIFGRRIETFATIQGSVGACFRIAMESEYDWTDMSAEFFWAAAIWAWSFLMLIVLLFLNMVLAIILDIYNETREGSFPGEAIWETMSHFLYRFRNYRSWIPDKKLEASFAEESDKGMVTRQDLDAAFPKMPQSQINLFYNACRMEMKWDSAKDLTKTNLLKLIGSVHDALDAASDTTKRVTQDESDDPLRSWVQPTNAAAAKGVSGTHSFLADVCETKGGKQPRMEFGPDRIDNYSANGPEWLKEVWSLLAQQREFINFANWHLTQMQWQIQQGMESRQYETKGEATIL
jgi:hypothetical protein